MSCRSYSAQSLWQSYQPEFQASIMGQSPEVVDSYIQKCCTSLLSQGVSWETVAQIRIWMQACRQDLSIARKLDYPEEERKTPPVGPSIRSVSGPAIGVGAGQSSPPEEVQVKFTRSDWERTKGKIVSYNKQLDHQRRKSVQAGRTGSLLETPYIRYTELGRVES